MQKFLHTEEDVLVLALRYLDELDVVRDSFASEYGLRPNTLTDIGSGKVLKKGRMKYRNAMISKLEAMRQIAAMRHQDKLVSSIKDKVYSIVLVEIGIASLDEQMKSEMEEKHRLFMQQFK